MDYISVKVALGKWCILERWIQKLCEEKRFNCTERFGRASIISKDAEKPIVGRAKKKLGDIYGQ